MPDKKPIKLYLAILNKGWIRREIVQKTIPEIKNTAGIELTLENLSKTWANPIFANRNAISKRFLTTDCEFMMQLDNDVIPLTNPAELVFANKDIIGMPAKVRQAGRAVNWVAYVKHPTEDGYGPVDFSRVDVTVDLLKVDAIGTGCIIIRRNVIEELSPPKMMGGPFTIEMDEWGLSQFGTDFAFCRRAQKAGFEIYTTPQRTCEHIKEIGLLDIQGYDDSDSRDPAAGKYQIPWGEWAICQKDWEFIRSILLTNKDVKRVIEFGSGLSSLMISEYVDVVSYETDKDWAKVIRDKIIPGTNRLEVREWDGVTVSEKLKHGEFDLCFVDGPKGKINGGIGREHSIRLASEVCDKIILHDGGRKEETDWQIKFLRDGFNLVSKSGNHQARCNYWIRK
jgi:hypothetical protein